MRNKKLKRRFIFILILFTVSVAGLWMIYHNTVTMYIRQTTEEAIALSKNNLLTDLNDEFTRLNAAVTVIGGSIFTQEFLIETEVDSYYEKAAAVAEIIRKTVYPALNGDSIYTISANGSFYRFTGGISSDAFESIYKELIGRTTVYSVVELGETGWFCLSSTVYQH
ncbi:MAG: hypothetical protein LBD23_09450, partial [Oscillospiraceae bacterium]|nr:hypothetical protein [Oscillospiraceae bacterium]